MYKHLVALTIITQFSLPTLAMQEYKETKINHELKKNLSDQKQQTSQRLPQPVMTVINSFLDNPWEYCRVCSSEMYKASGAHGINHILKLSDRLIAFHSDHAWLEQDRSPIHSKNGTITIYDIISHKRVVVVIDDRPFPVNLKNIIIKLSDTLIAVAGGNTIQLLDISIGKCLSMLQGHTKDIVSLIKLSKNRIASGSLDGTIRIWDIDAQECLFTLTGHSAGVNQIITLSKNTIASCSHDHTIKTWDLNSGKCLVTFEGHLDSVTSIIQLSAANICSTSRDKTINNWDIESGLCIFTFKTGGYVNSITRLAKKQIVFYCEGADYIEAWDIARGKRLALLDGHTDRITSLKKLSDTIFVSTSMDKTIRIWNIKLWYVATITSQKPLLSVVPLNSRSFIVGSTYGDNLGIISVNEQTLQALHKLNFQDRIRFDALIKQLRRLRKQQESEYILPLQLTKYGEKWRKAMPVCIQKKLENSFDIAPQSSCIIS